MLPPAIQRNDARARYLIGGFSIVAFVLIAFLGRVKLDLDTGFDPRIFAKANAIINSGVSLLLLAGLVAIKLRKPRLHRGIMLSAIILSSLFLISYVCHHLLSSETKFGDLDHNGMLSADEKAAAGSLRMVYYFILLTHIPLAAIILPLILYSAYRALTADWPAHRKLVRYTWPVWFYVSLTGVIVYLMISPYYS
jgi:putative membrane protein